MAKHRSHWEIFLPLNQFAVTEFTMLMVRFLPLGILQHRAHPVPLNVPDHEA